MSTQTPLNYLSFSLFRQEQWRPEVWPKKKVAPPVVQNNLAMPFYKRRNAVLAEMFRQSVQYFGAYIATSFFLSPEDRVRFAALGVGCFVGSASCLVISHALHAAHLEWRSHKAKFYFQMESIAFIASQLFMATFYVMTISRVVHQLGHVISALVLFKNPNPIMKIEWLFNNSTTISPQDLTFIGKSFGWANAIGIQNAAGPILGLAHELSLIRYAHDKRKDDPVLATQAYLRVFLSSVGTALLALSALRSAAGKQNDFNRLQDLFGIHPVVAAGFFLAVPPIYQYFALEASDSMYREHGTRYINQIK